MIRKLSLLFIMLVTSMLTGCSPQQDMVLRIGTNQWPGYETLYLARELNYFDSGKIKLKELTSSTEVIRAFKQGQIDVAALTLDEVILLAQTEHDLRVFLVMDISNGADKVIVNNSIEQLSDLKGKRIAVESSALGAYMMHHLLEAAQLSPSDILIQSTTIDQHYQQLTRDHSDAVISFDPVATSLMRLGYTCIFDSSQISGKIVDVLVTRQSVIEQQYDNINALVQAQWRSLDYLQSHPNSAYQKIVPRLHISVEELAMSYKTLKLPTIEQNQLLLSDSDDAGLYTTVSELTQVLYDSKLITSKPDTRHLLTGSFVQ